MLAFAFKGASGIVDAVTFGGIDILFLFYHSSVVFINQIGHIGHTTITQFNVVFVKTFM